LAIQRRLFLPFVDEFSLGSDGVFQFADDVSTEFQVTFTQRIDLGSRQRGFLFHLGQFLLALVDDPRESQKLGFPFLLADSSKPDRQNSFENSEFLGFALRFQQPLVFLKNRQERFALALGQLQFGVNVREVIEFGSDLDGPVESGSIL